MPRAEEALAANNDDNNNQKNNISGGDDDGVKVAKPTPTAPRAARRDLVAETYIKSLLAQLVERSIVEPEPEDHPQEAAAAQPPSPGGGGGGCYYVDDYPARVFHLKPPLAAPTQGAREGVPRSTEPGSDGDDWQSAFLWQPVLPVDTGSSDNSPQEHHRRRPMTEADKINIPHFLWFHLGSPSSSSAPVPNNKNNNTTTTGIRLAFRPYKDILFLDTFFLKTFLDTASPSTLADPLLGGGCPPDDGTAGPGSSIFSFLPRSAAQRASIKMVAVSAEPLRRANLPPASSSASPSFPSSLVADDGDDDKDKKDIVAMRARKEADATTTTTTTTTREKRLRQHQHRRRRRDAEAHDLLVRHRAVARLLVSLFPGLERVYLVEMASVPRPLSSTITNSTAAAAASDPSSSRSSAERITQQPPLADFAKWATLRDAVAVEKHQHQHQRSSSSRGISTQKDDPFLLPLHNRALAWTLLSPLPPKNDHESHYYYNNNERSPTSFSPLLLQPSSSSPQSLPGLLTAALHHARLEALTVAKWRDEHDRERADEGLARERRRRHRRIGFSRGWPEPGEGIGLWGKKKEKQKQQRPKEGKEKREEGEEEGGEEEEGGVVGVEARPFVMMYFRDAFEQARENGWVPGETLDLGHLDLDEAMMAAASSANHLATW